MAERRPALFAVAPSRGFADAIARELVARHGGDPLALARGVVLLPNNRGIRALTEAFVRATADARGGGLLLPRLVTIGDPELDDGVGLALDEGDAPIPPAISAMERRMLLAQCVQLIERCGSDEAVRLAGELARTLDQLTVEGVDAARLHDVSVATELADHWQRSFALMEVVTTHWPEMLAERGQIDLQDRRNRQLAAVAERWRASPPDGYVVAAGIANPAPAAARLLRVVSELPQGAVVFAGLDAAMPDVEWDAIGPHDADEAGRPGPRAIETHPQFHLKLLLDRMGVNRREVADWPGEARRAPAARDRAIANAMRPAQFTDRWIDESADRALPGVTLAEFATPADEAQAIALALREMLETPARSGALVTPDRALARRVAAHLARWGVAIDDSAGQPLSALAGGTLPIVIAEAAAQRFAPVPLLTLLKHPLVAAGEARLAWLDGARALDLALRGPRPAAGLDGIAAHLADGEWRGREQRRAARVWWEGVAPLLRPIETAFAGEPRPLAAFIAAVREAADRLSNGAVWAGPAGRAASEAIDAIEAAAPLGPGRCDPAEVAPLLTTLFDETAVRPPQGGHPRLAIYGLVEARLQGADLVVLAGLNEGAWPSTPPPDPWLAPAIRGELGLPGLERRIGIAGHDFAMGMGAGEVLITRARRDAGGPAVASRLWLRLQAMAGSGLAHDRRLTAWAHALDDAGVAIPAARPRPAPPIDERPRRIAVTDVDRLKADPYAFYARSMLGLGALDPIDADPSPAWRGTAVHGVLEQWAKLDGCDPEALMPRARTMLGDARTHPMMRALWQPRLLLAIEWIAARMALDTAEGRRVLAAERKGVATIAGVTLSGTADRIDRLADGGLAIVDYKTGAPPTAKAVAAGYSLQLGLLGLIAEAGGFEEIAGTAGCFEYWSLARNDEDGFGKVTSPTTGRTGVPADRFVALAAHNLAEAVERWLTGSDPFVAKLHPEHAPYGDYDQLMRRDEWFGRG